MTSWSCESDEVDNSSFDTLVLYICSDIVMFSSSITPKLRTTFTGVIGLPNNTMSFRRKVGFLLLLCSQINSVFKGLSLRRLEDIQRLTDSEQSLKSCRATCSLPSRKWQYTCKSSANTCAERPKPCMHQCNKICSVKKEQNWSQHGPLRHPKIQIKRRCQNAMNRHLLTPPRQVRRKPIQCITSNTKANIQPLEKYGTYIQHLYNARTKHVQHLYMHIIHSCNIYTIKLYITARIFDIGWQTPSVEYTAYQSLSPGLNAKDATFIIHAQPGSSP